MYELSTTHYNATFTDLNSSELMEVDGGVIPLVVWFVALPLLGKIGVVGAGAGAVGLGIAVGNSIWG